MVAPKGAVCAFACLSMQSEESPQVNTAPIIICPLCSGQHRLRKWELMKAKSPEERKSFVQEADYAITVLEADTWPWIVEVK